jgi:hypothetical protein
MTEAVETAVEKLDDLIVQSQSAESPSLYPFDLEFIAVSFNARPNSETPKIVWHKLRKPTLQQLKDRESQVKNELITVSSREDEDRTDETVANANLWRKLIVTVKGYKGAPDWRELSDAEKDGMKPGHKSRAIAQMYMGACLVEAGEDDDVSIGAETWTIRQEIGARREPDFIVRHSLREPSQGELEKFKGSAARMSYVRGSKKPHRKFNTNLQSYCDLYDAILLSIDGATVDGKTFSPETRKAFLLQIDPIWKKKIIETLMDTLEGQSSD